MVKRNLAKDWEEMKKTLPDFERGVISTLNHIEIQLTEIISVDICEEPKIVEQRADFFKYFDEMVLERKINLVKLILKNNYPNILKKYPDYIANLHNLRTIRNKIAHNTRTFTKSENKIWLTLSHPVIKKSSEDITLGKMKGLIKKSEKVATQTQEIRKSIGISNKLKF